MQSKVTVPFWGWREHTQLLIGSGANIFHLRPTFTILFTLPWCAIGLGAKSKNA